ncbi:PPOX class F420-dependent oxidoreductase [Rhodococcus pyridinivorans]|uniref:PPOX class F420-dependent oxidoreductase n=1 Tax=Rhodococcus pyridinivorans TaxID=103816 RepID=A0A7M2XIW9_9NOCA|nr:PPOX class F420-dependent oxidoreductase [Rhodococcus pyridinivorans]QOV97302.1 PPOX class F420-dependent oxidoreductase [Rhodococcus pyridinivorans]WMM71203.1 PPOX class F420-dependent oxidoreductase [Rhodococcus pyridinivorans]
MGTNRRAGITMTESEIDEFLHRSRVANLATLGPTGTPHLVAMWYAVLDGEIWFETKAKSQKVVNLRRDDRVTVLVEAGDTYDQLRGVSIEGRAEIVDDHDRLFEVCRDVWERYTAPYTEEARPAVEQMMHKRVAVRVVPARVRSWDHCKLGMPAMEIGGTTAAYLPSAAQ